MNQLCSLCGKIFNCKGKELHDFLQSYNVERQSPRQKEEHPTVLEKGEAPLITLHP